jgi:serine/threonine protein kinase
VHTLKQLIAGEIKPEHLGPQHRLQLSENLTEFPQALFSFADSLEILDLSNNQLSALPHDLHRFKKLRILFLSNNLFDHIPRSLADCPKLEMISFKSNCLTRIDENTLPIDTRWLILTDNKITRLPNSMGNLHRLQKCALAGNQLQSLPDSMAQCTNLQLMRLSANQLTSMPDWLFTLPKITWLAFSGNRLSVSNRSLNEQTHKQKNSKDIDNLPNVPVTDIALGKQLGEGASGIIYQGTWVNRPVLLALESTETNNVQDDIAVKIFKGDVTSDGYPQDELDCCLKAKQHPNLIRVLAKIVQPNQLGLIMELIPPTYSNLGLPPSLESCTRDTFPLGCQFSLSQILKISLNMADVLAHLSNQQLSHGDIYAHNTMIDEQANMLLGDFGAATDLSTLPYQQMINMEKVEVRAFACLLDDLLIHGIQDKHQPAIIENILHTLRDRCMQDATHLRPTFQQIVNELGALCVVSEH